MRAVVIDVGGVTLSPVRQDDQVADFASRRLGVTGGEDAAADLAEARAAQHDLVAVGEEGRRRAVPAQLDQRAALVLARARRSCPSRAGRPCAATRRWRSGGRSSAPGSSRARARSWPRSAPRRARPRARGRAPRAARAGRAAAPAPAAGARARARARERRHPGGDRGRERLAEERAERLVLPRLEVARAPVVEQHDAEDVVERLARPRRARRARSASPITKPSSSSMSSAGSGRTRARRPPRRYCPHGRTTSVPLTTTVPARPW